MSMITPELLTPREVAAIFRVDVKTVSRWAKQGKLRSTRTAGGHHRFYADSVRELIDTMTMGRTVSTP